MHSQGKAYGFRWDEDMLIRIGLTGGIAAGKSTVAARFKENGACVIDYDVLARQAVIPGSAGLHSIVQEFGDQAIIDGHMNRSWIAQQIFASGDSARKRLSAIIHPEVYRLAQNAEQEVIGLNTKGQNLRTNSDAVQVIVHDIPLLAEVIDELPFDFHHIVTVEAPIEVRIQRMVQERDMDEEQALARIQHQPSESVRRAMADTVIDSTMPLEQMYESIDKLYASWKQNPVA